MNKGPSITPIFAQHFNCHGCYKYKPSSGTDYKCICKKAHTVMRRTMTYRSMTDRIYDGDPTRL